ncbi:hypothetical protein O7635_03055 [Asanoa sp. WMMD1127]|uniref:hypothetical protein n=1 Tax=Asanoa sp. WMMD1127 TaxID=3016107 RepID=UPI002416D342|nr:hypothetical protein [Asanoa sp. WMMD1127]MDG4820830.1 hypothetical protein [Asanoa sp. WMMD1127]
MAAGEGVGAGAATASRSTARPPSISNRHAGTVATPRLVRIETSASDTPRTVSPTQSPPAGAETEPSGPEEDGAAGEEDTHGGGSPRSIFWYASAALDNGCRDDPSGNTTVPAAGRSAGSATAAVHQPATSARFSASVSSPSTLVGSCSGT